MDQYHLSDEAYDNLIVIAETFQFISKGTEKKRGISEFFNALAEKDFIDTRPDELREYDEAMLRNYRQPMWGLGLYTRRPRYLKLTDKALELYVKHAILHRIFVGREYTGGPYFKSQIAITAAILEAIGLHFLTPVEFPSPKTRVLHEVSS